MNPNYIAVVDYSKIQYFGELHTILRDALEWPEWYGCNLDAMDDILIDEELPKKIIFIGVDKVNRHKDWGEYFQRMLSILDEMKKIYQEDGQEFSYELR